MQKAAPDIGHSMPPFYKFKGGVRGKYHDQYRAGTNLVLLEPDVYRAFPTAGAVNRALRSLLVKS